MWMVLTAAALGLPRIVALTNVRCKHILADWERTASPEDSARVERLAQFRCMCERELDHRGVRRGLVGLIDDHGDCRAIAQFAQPPLTLTRLEVNDQSSGTTLLRALLKTKAEIEFADTVDDRWVVARGWIAESLEDRPN